MDPGRFTGKTSVLTEVVFFLRQSVAGALPWTHSGRRLSGKALTLLMQEKRQDEEVKVKRKDRRHVNALLRLGRAGKHKVLNDNEVWTYQPAKGARAQDLILIKGVVDDALFSGTNLGEAGEADPGEEEEDHDEAPLGPACNYAPPLAKRLRGKQGEPLLEEGWTAIIGAADSPSRMSQELGCPVYCCGFGMQRMKPLVLRRWGALHTTCEIFEEKSCSHVKQPCQ
eukprot:Skav217308  [mRNA]  locus=scaffold1466:451693:452434:+ [translate_table: standard]